ncbi:MAG: cache domain-containing protein [Candidatus Hydrogenedentes bacterium]|nr:cache domain-containing protein [Candidatus Hydrogenedentota bacterium]
MKLRTKVTLVIVIVFAVSAVILASLQVWWVDTLLIRQTNERMALNIRSAWQVLDDQKRLLATIAAFLVDTKTVADWRETGPEALHKRLTEQKMRWGLDILALLQPDGTVYVRSLSTEVGDKLGGQPLADALSGKRPTTGFLHFDSAAVAREGVAWVQRCTLPDHDGSGLVLFAVQPIVEQKGGDPTAYVFAGILLNRAEALIDEIHQNIFSEKTYNGRSVGTVTIFLGPTRISTTVRLSDDRRALGTKVSEEVKEQVLDKGQPWTGPAKVIDESYLSCYEPIRDPVGGVIGMLYVGELEQIYRDIESETVITIVAVVFAVMALALFVSYVGERGVLRQVVALDRATQQFARGDLTARAEIRSSDEIGALAESFNAMAEQIENDHTRLMSQKLATDTANKNYLDMLGFVTHELRSTISAALFNAALLKDGSYGELTPDLKEGIDSIDASLAYLLEITGNYLQLSRIERGDLVVVKSKVPLLKSVIQPTLDHYDRLLSDRGMRVEVNVPSEFTLEGDVNLLRMVYDNLVGNAIKYGKTGGRIVLDARVEGSHVVLAVWNEGKGIPKALLPVLFQKFQRHDVDETTGRKGTGLGLFIVKQIVTRHGGIITVDSKEGVDVRFAISLPS